MEQVHKNVGLRFRALGLFALLWGLVFLEHLEILQFKLPDVNFFIIYKFSLIDSSEANIDYQDKVLQHINYHDCVFKRTDYLD